MPKVAYSDKEREQIREDIIITSLKLMSKQGIQHTTIEQIYKKVGISRTFFYSFFPTKEDLILEMFYYQQPKIIEYLKKLMSDSSLSWRDKVKKFIYSCCYGEKYGIAVLTIEEQQLVFKRISEENQILFRSRQKKLFRTILECFGVNANEENISLFINLCLTIFIIRRAIPDTLPFFIPEAADKTVDFQIEGIINFLEKIKS